MKKENNSKKGKYLIRHHLCLLMRKMDYDDITVSDICKAANISRMSFYRYYNKKDDIFVDYTDERFADFFDQAKALPSYDPLSFLNLLFSYIKKYKKELLILKSAKKEYLLLPQFISYAKYLLGKKNKSVFYKDLSETSIVFIAGGIFSIIMNWLENGMKTSPSDLAKGFIPILNNSLLDIKIIK